MFLFANAAHQRADWQELGRLNAIPLEETARIYARVGRLLWNQRVLQTHTTARPMDTPPGADVLLEDVETS